jgi:hypothetical protein
MPSAVLCSGWAFGHEADSPDNFSSPFGILNRIVDRSKGHRRRRIVPREQSGETAEIVREGLHRSVLQSDWLKRS